MTTRVMIIEDHGLLAQSLQLALRADGFEVEISFGATAEEILAAAGRMRPAVVLLDLDLGPGVGSALPLIGPLRELGACVVMVTGEENRTRLGECVEAGAIGIVPKSAPFDHLVESVKEAAGLRTLMSKSERDQLLAEMRRQHADNERQQAVFSGLTPRESEVLAGLYEGKSADAIARESYVSVATVRSQIHSLLQKLGVNSQIGAVAAARRAGWDPQSP